MVAVHCAEGHVPLHLFGGREEALDFVAWLLESDMDIDEILRDFGDLDFPHKPHDGWYLYVQRFEDGRPVGTGEQRAFFRHNYRSPPDHHHLQN